jgi:hypothetical protein
MMLNRDKAQMLTKETLQQNPALALLFLRRSRELKSAKPPTMPEAPDK